MESAAKVGCLAAAIVGVAGVALGWTLQGIIAGSILCGLGVGVLWLTRSQ